MGTVVVENEGSRKNVALSSNGAQANAKNYGTCKGNERVASKAIDGDISTSWGGTWTYGGDNWLKVEFKKKYEVDRIKISTSSHKLTYYIQVSEDGSNWQTVADSTTHPAGEYKTYNFPATEAKYAKVVTTDTDAPSSHIWQYIIDEFEVYNTKANVGQINRYGLVVGITDYAKTKLHLFGLPTPIDDPRIGGVNDANNIYKLLTEQFNFDNGDVTKLTGKEATRDTILDKLSNYAQKVDSNDKFVFYFAGHGGRHDKTGSEVIAPYDVNVEKNGSKVIPIFSLRLESEFDNIDGEKLAIFDSCNSGGMAKETDPDPSNNEDGIEGNDTVVLMASKATEGSYSWYYEWGGEPSGRFTHYFLEAFDKLDKADENGDNRVSAEEAFSYSKERVWDMFPTGQNPQIADGNSNEEFFLSDNVLLISDTLKPQIATFHAGTWWVDANGNGQWDGPNTDIKIKGFGSAGNQVAIADLDNDGTDELATFKAGTWWIDKNDNFRWDGPNRDKKIPGFGTSGNKVAAADFDNDGKAEIATFNRGNWWVDMNNNGEWDGNGTDLKIDSFGNASNQVAAADFDGDGRGEIATFKAGTWWIDLNNNGKWDGKDVDKKVRGYGTASNIVAAGNLPAPSSVSSAYIDLNRTLSLTSALAYPNPASSTDQVTFKAQGKNIRATKLQVFTASGEEVYKTNYTQGTTTTWKLNTNEGKPAPNGAYLYQVKARGEDGQTTTSQFEKLIVLK